MDEDQIKSKPLIYVDQGLRSTGDFTMRRGKSYNQMEENVIKKGKNLWRKRNGVKMKFGCRMNESR